jgi:hypothetical protein
MELTVCGTRRNTAKVASASEHGPSCPLQKLSFPAIPDPDEHCEKRTNESAPKTIDNWYLVTALIASIYQNLGSLRSRLHSSFSLNPL